MAASSPYESDAVPGVPSAALSEEERKALESFCHELPKSADGKHVSPAEALKFLMARKFDKTRALDLFKSHQELREKVFLDHLWPQEMPLSQELATGKFTFLDGRSKDGCALGLLTLRLFKPPSNDAEKLLLFQNIFFNLDESLRSIETQRNGLMIIINLLGTPFAHMDRRLAVEVLDMLQEKYPARLKRVFVVDAPWWIRAICAIVWPFLKQKIRDRVVMVTQTGLQRFLNQDVLPVSLGGAHPSFHDEWLKTCIRHYNMLHSAEARRQPAVAKQTEEPQERPVVPVETPSSTEENELVPTPPMRTKSLTKVHNNERGHGASPAATSVVKPVLSTENSMSLSELQCYIDDLGRGGLQREYAVIRRERPNGTFTSTRLPYNLPKNRYADILCLEETRVHLEPLYSDDEELPGSDYINANYVDGLDRPRAYIASQGPLPSTFGDFWRMVWEQRVQVIVMTTRLAERGRIKCGQYWPDVNQVLECGDITVQTMEEFVGNDYTTREIKLTWGDAERGVVQFQFTGWPDFGVPASSQSMLEVIAHMHERNIEGAEFLRETEGEDVAGPPGALPPVIVHCSAGIGRTGTLMATDLGCQSLKNTGKVDIQGIIRWIRNQRALCIQSPEQYEFVFTSVCEYGTALSRQRAQMQALELNKTACSTHPPPLPGEVGLPENASKRRAPPPKPAPYHLAHTSGEEEFEVPSDCDDDGEQSLPSGADQGVNSDVTSKELSHDAEALVRQKSDMVPNVTSTDDHLDDEQSAEVGRVAEETAREEPEEVAEQTNNVEAVSEDLQSDQNAGEATSAMPIGEDEVVSEDPPQVLDTKEAPSADPADEVVSEDPPQVLDTKEAPSADLADEVVSEDPPQVLDTKEAPSTDTADEVVSEDPPQVLDTKESPPAGLADAIEVASEDPQPDQNAGETTSAAPADTAEAVSDTAAESKPSDA